MLKKILYSCLLINSYMMPVSAQPSIADQILQKTLVDLSHVYNEQTIYWPTEDNFQLIHEHQGITDSGYYYAANRFISAEHGGTHIDAPRHFNQQGKTVDQLPLQQLIGNGIVIDVQEKTADNRDYQIEIEDFLAWEKQYGTIPTDAIVLLNTGFAKYWPDQKRYLGTDEHGEQAIVKLHFPGLSPNAAEWLMKNRKIKAIGLDTASIDYGQSTEFGSHVILFAHGIPAFENLTHLNKLPAKGFSVIALPMNIEGGSGAPLRIVATIP